MELHRLIGGFNFRFQISGNNTFEIEKGTPQYKCHFRQFLG
jgi:hypothetical protein